MTVAVRLATLADLADLEAASTWTAAGSSTPLSAAQLRELLTTEAGHQHLLQDATGVIQAVLCARRGQSRLEVLTIQWRYHTAHARLLIHSILSLVRCSAMPPLQRIAFVGCRAVADYLLLATIEGEICNIRGNACTRKTTDEVSHNAINGVRNGSSLLESEPSLIQTRVSEPLACAHS